MPVKVLFFFGLAGAGKTYVGQVAGEHLGWPVYEADTDLLEEMHTAIREKTLFTDEMRAKYFAVVKDNILKTKNHKPNYPT